MTAMFLLLITTASNRVVDQLHCAQVVIALVSAASCWEEDGHICSSALGLRMMCGCARVYVSV